MNIHFLSWKKTQNIIENGGERNKSRANAKLKEMAIGLKNIYSERSVELRAEKPLFQAYEWAFFWLAASG